MIEINWHEFGQLAPITLVGLFIHILGKFGSALKRDDYCWKKFKRLNGIGFIMSFLLCGAGIYFMSAGVILLPGIAPVVVSFFIGWGGGSFIRKGMQSIESMIKLKGFWSKIFNLVKIGK